MHHLCQSTKGRAQTMLKPGKQWKSMCKGLILGTLLTSCMILLYSYTMPPRQYNSQEIPVPFSCSSSKRARSRSVSRANGSLLAGTGAARAICSPKVDIMFMKTHKTGSSTILNILFRFGQKHGLKFAFPNGRNDFYYPSRFDRSHVKGYRPGTCFNVICNHMRFNYEEVRKILPEDSIFFTILRDPADLFESSLHYFGRVIPLTWTMGSEDKLGEFLRDPWRHYDPNGFNAHYLKNLLFFDFGFDNNLSPEDPRVLGGIRAIDERFHLVMLLEHFDESLVLLKELLCWDFEDILYFKLNVRKDSTVSRMTGELYRQATEWNAIDALLYRHFNSTFWAKVERYGRERMARDVAELRKVNDAMRSVCIAGGRAVDASAIQEASLKPWQPLGERSIMGYNLKTNISKKERKLCRKMLTPEIQYLTELGVNLWLTKLWARVRDLLKW
ncbi:galactosylceramide sulfotransferase [Callorhinchus milii]|uniref:Galactose-3-O-sulfotransferase 1a n=1 Tax=Callorhinchus milii TaxID=7868 RepID=A0A4W3HJ41_CALMI|nr:galactosylceramide sulfotransferase [Callorhinchus milii]|eukprot:gi/632968331/ref/XP_007900468.1/ PREDICTED: galactosylceramide sulfotransferase [Callorhinchus milii]